MIKVVSYSLIMILGLLVSQAIDLAPLRKEIQAITITALAYIMIEVGLEFTLNKKKIGSYGKDYLVAMTAATFPWILCGLYFWTFFDISLSDAAIIGRFASPTSTGVLFAMLAAAGLASTWIFKKVRILAIFDDLDTVLLIIPLQMIHLGFNTRALFLLTIIAALLYVAYRYLHVIKIPCSKPWLLLYALLLTGSIEWFEKTTLIALEVILPAFVLGCLIRNPHNPKRFWLHRQERAFIQSEKRWERLFDDILKLTYMFLVGCSLPKIHLETTSIAFLLLHVLAITFLANVGKLYPALCYKKEASVRERLALSIAMWPRGEVGAGILILSMGYAISPVAIQLAQLSLALNLALTGVFIYAVIRILRK